MFRKFTLKRKIIAIVILTSGIVLLLASVALILREGVSFWKEGKQKLTVLAEIIGSSASAPILFGDHKAAEDTLTRLNSNPHICAAYILDDKGKIFAAYTQTDTSCNCSPTLPADPATILKKARASSFPNWGSDQIVAKPVLHDGTVVGTVVIQSDTKEFSLRLKWFIYVFTAIALVVLFIAYYISSKLQGIISEPILELAGAMKTISEERNYSIRARKGYDDEIGVLINGFNEMLDQIEERDEKLAHLAHFDSLTLLPNRLLFRDRLSQTLSRAARMHQQVAILFIDLDEFKGVNDTLGHRVGDLLLKEIAGRLLAQVRQSDTVARLGGDEFIVFLQDIGNVANVIAVAEKILQTFANHFTLEGKELFITSSVGIALFPADGTTDEELIKNADTAMYHAKRLGKNCFQFFSSQMHKLASRRLTLINSLRRALERQEFVIHYQPKVEISSGRIIGMEALLRWNHPEQGFVLPEQFIPLAEETGIIIPIGEWVIQTVCGQIKEWIDADLCPPTVAVNISAYQFRTQNLVAVISRVLQETGVAPSCLELELTESAIMINPEESMETISALKALGVHISIDDFGTGYSSLVHLKRFPIDRVKIDRSFVKNISDSLDDRDIVVSIIDMAKNLNLKVIAEGVETEEQLSFLDLQGCHEIQGYLCSKAVPPDQIITFLLERNWRNGTSPASPCKVA